MKVDYSTGNIIIITDDNGNKCCFDFNDIPALTIALFEATNYSMDSFKLWNKIAELSNEHNVWGKNDYDYY